MFKKSKKGYYFWEDFSKINGLVHGVSTRSFGSIKNNGKINEKNLDSFLTVLHVDRRRVVFPRQVHGSSVLVVNGVKKREIGDGDGLITKRKNIFLGIVTADCLPVIFYDEKKGIVGVAHGGYKGLLSGILEEMLKAMKKIGADIRNIKIAIGPAIGVCCYDVPYDRVQMFVRSDGDSGRALLRPCSGSLARMTNVYQVRKGKYFLDLKNTAKQILILEGISEKNIEASDICTKDNIKDFFSFRGEGPKSFGEFVTIVGRL